MEHVWTPPICQEVFPFLEDSRCMHVYGLLTMEDAMIFRASMENSRAFSSTRSRSQGPKFHTGSERAGPTGLPSGVRPLAHTRGHCPGGVKSSRVLHFLKEFSGPSPILKIFGGSSVGQADWR